MQSVLFLAWALPLAAWLARTAFAPAAGRTESSASPGRHGRTIAVVPQQ